MAVTLLRIQGGCSLEFDESDIDRVRDALKEHYGAPVVDKNHPWLTICRFPGAELTFHNEWEDPCLIAGNAIGVAILERIAEVLA